MSIKESEVASKVKMPNKEEKKKKIQCNHCLDLFNLKYIKGHSRSCERYKKFRNGSQCCICMKKFDRPGAVNQHIGHHHKGPTIYYV